MNFAGELQQQKKQVIYDFSDEVVGGPSNTHGWNIAQQPSLCPWQLNYACNRVQVYHTNSKHRECVL